MKKIFSILFILTVIMMTHGCKLDVVPSDALTGDQIKKTSDGLIGLVNGCYAQLKDYPDPNVTNNWYFRQFFHLSDFASDDIVCGYKTEDDLINSFRYSDRTPEKSNINSFWEVSYKIIYGSNVAIAMATLKGSDPLTDQLKGESYFLRAFSTHCLVRLFAKPYNQQNLQQPGVIIRESSEDVQPKSRATLEQTYTYILSSLNKADSLLSTSVPTQRDTKGFATKYSVWALKTRVYLYKGDLDSCITYADKLINSGNYSLATADVYPGYFAAAKSNAETIWCVPFNTVDDKKEASVASMIFNGPSCWGEEGASPSILNEMGLGTDLTTVDQRWKYINIDNPGLKNGVTIYYVSKFSNQGNIATLSSPVMFRLAEVYLNRAEAYAKKGMVAEALADIKTIRENRLIVPSGKTIDDYMPLADASTILDVVLKERRIELAFEGHRLFDLLRNGKDLVRNYWGFHLDNYNGIISASEPGLDAAGVVIKANDARTTYPIPSGEMSTNNKCVQNN